MFCRQLFNTLGCPAVFCPKTNLSKTNYSKPFREPSLVELLYRVYLKHQNSIWKKSKFKSSKILSLGFKKSKLSFCWCCPAGGLDLRKSRFLFLLMLPCGRPRSWKITCFLYLFNSLHAAKLLYLLGFEPREYARSVSFEKCCRMH